MKGIHGHIEAEEHVGAWSMVAAVNAHMWSKLLPSWRCSHGQELDKPFLDSYLSSSFKAGSNRNQGQLPESINRSISGQNQTTWSFPSIGPTPTFGASSTDCPLLTLQGLRVEMGHQYHNQSVWNLTTCSGLNQTEYSFHQSQEGCLYIGLFVVIFFLSLEVGKRRVLASLTTRPTHGCEWGLAVWRGSVHSNAVM